MARERNVRPTLTKTKLKTQLPSIDPKVFDPQTFLASIGEGRRLLEFPKKGSIFVQGEPANAIYYLQKGRVRLTVVSQQGKEAIIGLLGPGDFFGEGCIAGQPLRMATALAMTDCSVVRIEKKAMMQVLHQQHAFSDLFVAYLLARNVRYEEDLVDQLFNSSEKRLARTLLLLARYGQDDKPMPLVPKISQETLAEMVGTTRSRVNFFLNKFKKLGFIEYDGEAPLKINNSLLSVVLHD